VHVPHVTMPPHPSGALPQFCVPQTSLGILGEQTQLPLSHTSLGMHAGALTQLPLASHACGRP